MNAQLIVIRSSTAARALAAVLGLYFPWLPAATAEMTMTLSSQPGSPLVAFSLAGTSTAISSFGSPFTGQVFDVNDGSDLFPPEITNASAPFGIYALASGGGTVSNLTAGLSSPVTSIVLQDAGLFGVARFGAGFSLSQQLMAGDLYAWSGAGTIDLGISGLTFNDLIQGASPGISQVGGLTGRLLIIPEPSAGVLSSIVLIAMYAARLHANSR
jgi:hypothetical protein